MARLDAPKVEEDAGAAAAAADADAGAGDAPQLAPNEVNALITTVAPGEDGLIEYVTLCEYAFYVLQYLNAAPVY